MHLCLILNTKTPVGAQKTPFVLYSQWLMNVNVAKVLTWTILPLIAPNLGTVLHPPPTLNLIQMTIDECLSQLLNFLIWLLPRPPYGAADSDFRARGGIRGRRGGGYGRNADNFHPRGKREYDRHNGTYAFYSFLQSCSKDSHGNFSHYVIDNFF